MAPRKNPYDLALDVCCPFNRRLLFMPAGGILAGEVDVQKFRGGVPLLITEIGGLLPGYRIELDVEGQKARIIDRLKFDEHKGLLEKIRRALNTETGNYQTLGENWRRDPVECIDEGEWDLSVDEAPQNVATWLWHIYKCHKARKLNLVRGVVPERDDIRAMGVVYMGDNYGRPFDPRTGWPRNMLYPPGREPEKIPMLDQNQ